jgi:hypothetical protein
MSVLAKLAWPVQIAIFVLLLFLLPHTPFRLLILFGYIAISIVLVRALRNKYH